MSLTLRSQISWLAVASVLAAGSVPFAPARAHASSVQTYVDQAVPAPVSTVPESSWTSDPVKPGDITMRDVLRAYAKKKPRADTLQQREAVTSGAIAPLLAPSIRPSTSGAMMMQGMRSVLRPAKAPAAASVAPPVASQSLPSDSGLQRDLAGLVGEASAPSEAPAVSAPVKTRRAAASPAAPVTIEGMQYQPGQEPRALGQMGGGAAVHAAAASSPSSGLSAPYPQPSAHEAGLSAADSQCSGRATAWVKSCVDAGYPDSFVGEIRGETRTGCSGGGLRDVWVSNTCSPPGDRVERADTAAAVSKPVAPSAKSVSNTLRAPVALAPAASARASDGRSGDAVVESRDFVASSLVPSVATGTVVAARCGPANGLAASRRPVADLCDAGQVTEVVGDGPWRWSCKGASGGMTVSCAAPYAQDAKREEGKGSVVAAVAPSSAGSGVSSQHSGSHDRAGKSVDGQCGSAADNGVDRAPSSNLCVQGLASRVSGDGPWSWACSGANGGAAAACIAPRKADGFCGASHGGSFDKMPTTGLCGGGYASAVTGDGPWNWTCSGLYGGDAATCSATRVVNAVCGPATLSGHRKAPADQLCSVGQASSVVGSGPWSWSCSGSHGGSQVACSSPVVIDGSCGSVNGVALPSAPSENLCSKGKPSLVSGDGPWMWSCLGSDGGESETCTAPRKQEIPEPVAAAVPASPSTSSSVSGNSFRDQDKEAVVAPKTPAGLGLCGSAAELAALVAPDHDLCARGSAGVVSGDGPWTWACKDASGAVETCSTLSLSSPPAFTETASVAPAFSGAVDSGHPSDVPNRKPPVPDYDQAAGVLSGSAGTSSSPSVPDSAPSDQPVALVKKSSSARKDAKLSSSPALASSSPAQATAACGSAAGQAASAAPSSGLCQGDAVASAVSGDGPWAWDCSNGNSKVSCAALKFVNGACGASNGAALDHAPHSGLCGQGSATEVYGDGPWLWTCVGAGGGGSSSCSTAEAQQARVDGVCGSAAREILQDAPKANLCDGGLASPVYGSGPWTWTCSGMNGGIASPCTASSALAHEAVVPSAPAAAVDGYCGSANGMAMAEQPVDGLCSSGQQTRIVGEGPWNWNCLGVNGGMSVSCTAPLLPPAPLDGACGSASGAPALMMPQSGLCASGISSAVSGKGPWTWSCSGINGGGAVGCVAPFAGKSAGLSSSAMPSLVTSGESIPNSAVSDGAASLASRDQAAGAPSAQAMPRSSGKERLVTPSLRAETLPPRKPALVPPSSQDAAGIPPALSRSEKEGLSAPVAPPARSAASKALSPPSLRGSDRKASSGSIDGDMALMPGNHFVLEDDVSVVAFSNNDSNFDRDAVEVLDNLASVLAANKGVRVTLTAYAGNKDITPRDARRLSLSRGLAVRDYLVSKGIAAARMDVRALGSNVPSGDPDRVDVRAN